MLVSILLVLLVSNVSVSQVLDGTFAELAVNWRSGQQSDRSLVSKPVVDFINDTAVTFLWDLKTTDPVARMSTNFDLEISFDLYSDDFQNYASLPVELPENYSNNTYSTRYTASGLQSSSNYRFRVCPGFSSGRGQCSVPLYITTLAHSVNYWEAILSRRLSLARSGRGFTNPVTQRPHLSTGVEVREGDISENSMRFSDPVTSETPVIPSGRRGHTLSLVDDIVYMFGGRTNGYSCATIYKDTVNLGNQDSGRDIYPCVHYQSEVSELWSFDIGTYQWIFLNTTKWQDSSSNTNSSSPPAREQHSATVIGRDIYIYGGKTRIFTKDEEGNDVLEHHSDVVHGDLWKLSVERAKQYVLQYQNDTPDSSGSGWRNASSIPQNGRLWATISGHNFSTVTVESDGITPREGLCIDKVIVRVRIQHPCVNQLKVSLTGPGPLSGSPNYFSPTSDHEVMLFNQLRTNSTGCAGGEHVFEFDDDSATRPDACCSERFNGIYQPQGRLAEFIGASMTADWTLIVQDLKSDEIQGELLDWEIEFTSSPCVRTYQWTDLSITSNTAPLARYGARILTHDSSLFLYGGRDAQDFALEDLYRYDTLTATWTALTPVDFYAALNPSSSIGANFALTSWGLLRYGGYYRQPSLPQDYNNYDSSVSVQDPVNMRWKELTIEEETPLPQDTTFGRTFPSSRYLSAAVFIPSHTLHWRTKFTHHNLYNDTIPSSRTNYQGSIADSLLMIGGFDGSTGSVRDGSTGGFLMDIWMLRLGNWSTPGSRYHQQSYLERHCRWRNNPTSLSSSIGTNTCMSLIPNTRCEWRDLIMLPWCARNNQTIM